ncbi:MAG: leucine dehydrogenase [Myxococcales bacterium]|nr:leucine dehydrogenase [Myxococcales bacterium]|tara:strand:- start:957 stop:2057 length:1101 start_codon:yes stop_codon:yes gene_type:complete
MSIFDQIASNQHEQLVFCHDPVSGLRAIIGIHDTTLGPALGGTRMRVYKSEQAAITDVLRLSRGMTYKSAVTGLNLGGGKAVIIGDPRQDKCEALFRSYGRFVESLNGRYTTAEDMGTGVADMEWVRMETDHVVGISAQLGGSDDPSPVTAMGTYEGMKAAARRKYGSESLQGKTIAVQGVGHVGYYLVQHLAREGARILISDVNEEAIATCVKEFGVEVVGLDDIYDAEMDIYAPCAIGATINDDTIDRLKCSIVAGSANNVLLDEDRHGMRLVERGILYCPDYVINAGGLINVANELEGYNQKRALSQAAAIHDTIRDILELASEKGIPPFRAANEIAERRIRRMGQVKSTFLGPRERKYRGIC